MKKFITEAKRFQKLAGILTESVKEDYLNSLLEKIFESGIESLSAEEKKYLDDVSQGTNAQTPNEYLQDLFSEWKIGEIEGGNDIENIYQWSDLHDFDQELQDGFLSYVDLVKKYPNLDREDLALVNSLGHAKEFSGTPIYTPYSEYNWNSLDEKTYNKIMFDEFNIEPEEDDEYDGSDEAYIKEFGHSFEEKQNWDKVLGQLYDKYNFDFQNPEDLKNWSKIEDEAKQIYKKKYGAPKYKKYPFRDN